MKKLILSTAMLVAFLSSGFGQNGTIFEYKISSPKGNSGIIKTYFTSTGSRAEIKMNNANINTSIVKNTAPTMVYVLDDKNKTYINTEMKQTAKSTTTSAVSDTRVMVTKESVGGYNCSKVSITKNGETRIYWTTTDISNYEQFNKPNSVNNMIGVCSDYELIKANGADGFVVKMLSIDNTGTEQTMELVNVEKKELNTSMFEVPADYTASAITAPSK